MKPQSKIATFFNALFVNFRHVGIFSKAESVVKRMNPTEKILFYISSLVMIVVGIMLAIQLNNQFLIEVPKVGGQFTEGLIGSPRFINPILAISDTDKDLTSLIYSGLLKSSSEGFVPNLAASYTISEDGTIYDVIIRDDAYFHDGKRVTADDVGFTIQKIIDPTIKSPKRANWEGVMAEKISDKEIRFTLSKPYAPFLEALTVGILPKHIWENASSEEFPFSEFNIDPVGSGPYKVDKVERNSGGIPTSITLSSFKNYTLGQSKIKSIIFKFFQNENEVMKALKDESVKSIVGVSPSSAKLLGSENVTKDISLPRVFGVFMNQNTAPVFLNHEVREALDEAAPKSRIISEVLHGFGRVIDGPVPQISAEVSADGNIESAKAILEDAGWTANESGILEKKTKSGTVPLAFSITTSDAPELKRTAEILQEAWGELGAEVEIKVFEAGDLSQNIIRGRRYDALLFGEVVSFESDLYPFWHSSQRVDPGLNISLYANITVDKELEELQKTFDKEEIASKKEIVLSEIQKDMPAVFLFSPNLLYVQPKNVKNISIMDVSSQSGRFVSIQDWYIETDKVWKFLAQ